MCVFFKSRFYIRRKFVLVNTRAGPGVDPGVDPGFEFKGKEHDSQIEGNSWRIHAMCSEQE